MSSYLEMSLVLVKPDGVERRLVGEILRRFEKRGLNVIHLDVLEATKDQVAAHYPHLVDSEHYPRIEIWMTRSPLVVAVLQGVNAVEVVRQTIGATDPLKAAPGTIRADYANWIGSNLVHGSASVEEAMREMKLWVRS
jgi:nucleoside-diphosphate kinase